MEQILDRLFFPMHWVWGAMASDFGHSWDESHPSSFIVLALITLLLLVLVYAIIAFTAHWAIRNVAWHWSKLLRKRAELGTVEEMLEIAIQARRASAWMYSLALRTGVQYSYTTDLSRHTPELAGADSLPQRRLLILFTTAIIAAGKIVAFTFRILRVSISSAFGLYILLGTAWTLQPQWFTTSGDRIHQWFKALNPATIPTAIGLIATLLGLVAAFAFSAKRRARHKSMFDAAVAAENTLTTLGSRAWEAADQVANFAQTVASHDHYLYEDAVEDFSDGRLCMRGGIVKMVNHKHSGGLFRSRKDYKWEQLCKQREDTLAKLNHLKKALAHVESLSPFARQAGRHSRALLWECRMQSADINPWKEVFCYDEDRYKQHRERICSLVGQVLDSGKGPTTGDGNTASETRQFHLEALTRNVKDLQSHSRYSLWQLADLYAKLVLCNEEVNRARHMRGINAFIARFIKA